MEASYVGIGPCAEERVEPGEAFDYALSHLPQLPGEDKREFVRWFFSGNYLEVQEE